MVLGTTAFLLALVISFFSEQPIKIVVKRSISSFFLFAFLGWLVGLLINYFSPPVDLSKDKQLSLEKEEEVDINKEFEDFIKNKELVKTPVETQEEKPESERIKETIEKAVKEEPQKVAKVIKGVLSRDEG